MHDSVAYAEVSGTQLYEETICGATPHPDTSAGVPLRGRPLTSRQASRGI